MKRNLLFRCAKLSTLTQDDISSLETLNPYAVIDFRDPKEINKAPDNLSKRLLKKYISLPISASTLGRMVAQKKIVTTILLSIPCFLVLSHVHKKSLESEQCIAFLNLNFYSDKISILFGTDMHQEKII